MFLIENYIYSFFGDYGRKDKLILPSLRKYVTSNETNQEKRRKVKSEVKEYLYISISQIQNKS